MCYAVLLPVNRISNLLDLTDNLSCSSLQKSLDTPDQVHFLQKTESSYWLMCYCHLLDLIIKCFTLKISAQICLNITEDKKKQTFLVG